MKTPAELADDVIASYSLPAPVAKALRRVLPGAVEQALAAERAQADARVAAEREACAALLQLRGRLYPDGDEYRADANEHAAAIRARGGKSLGNMPAPRQDPRVHCRDCGGQHEPGDCDADGGGG